MARKILIVEDDRDFAGLIRLNLEDQGYEVEVVHDGLAGSARIQESSYDLIVLDVMLPGLDGFEITRRIRAQSSYTPLLMLTARSAEMDRVLGLELGADDYLTKPVSLRELVARAKALFRRVDAMQGGNGPVTEAEEEHLDFGGLSIDVPRRKVTVQGEDVVLTAREFELLHHFALHPGRVYTRRELLDSVWGYGYDGYEHTVNSHINRLRSKVERDASEPDWILTVWGVGYKFRDQD